MTQAAAIILAAGASRRLGSPKQLARLSEASSETLLARAIRTAREAGLSPILVVLGANEEAIRNSGIAWSDELLLSNPQWAEGMASSLRMGIAAVPVESSGAVVMTCDMPAITAGHLQALLHASLGTQTIASRYAGRHGVPAYLPRSVFASLQQLKGDVGARALLSQATSVELADGEYDIDTPEDLLAARVRFGSSSGV